MPVPEDLRQRLAFLDFTERDAARLAELAPVFERNAETIVAAFYRHLLSFEPMRRLLADDAVKERVLDKQRAYLLSLAGPRIDEEYLRDRIRIGETHLRVGLEPRWYLGAYATHLRLLVPLVLEHYATDPLRAELAIGSLEKLFTLDMGIAMDAYIESRARELARLNDELASATEALREELGRRSEELHAVEERARAAERLASLATIVAGLAHEIGTPMSVIQGHAELLQSTVHDEKGRWRLETIRQQIDRIASIIRTLLNMARTHTPERNPVDLGAIVRHALSFLTEKFRHRGIEVHADLQPCPSVLGDEDRLQQALLNLFLNAADAMERGGRLEVAVGRCADGGCEVRIADTGPGIAPEIRERLFEPFVTTKPTGHGTGLGLMVVKGIVADHGGRIDVVSEPGKGTAFAITLPPA